MQIRGRSIWRCGVHYSSTPMLHGGAPYPCHRSGAGLDGELPVRSDGLQDGDGERDRSSGAERLDTFLKDLRSVGAIARSSSPLLQDRLRHSSHRSSKRDYVSYRSRIEAGFLDCGKLPSRVESGRRHVGRHRHAPWARSTLPCTTLRQLFDKGELKLLVCTSTSYRGCEHGCSQRLHLRQEDQSQQRLRLLLILEHSRPRRSHDAALRRQRLSLPQAPLGNGTTVSVPILADPGALDATSSS